jgi:hypothetical protein
MYRDEKRTINDARAVRAKVQRHRRQRELTRDDANAAEGASARDGNVIHLSGWRPRRR